MGLLLLVTTAEALTSARLLSRLGFDWRREKGHRIGLGLLEIAWTLFIAWFETPVPIILAVFFCMLFAILFPHRRDRPEYIIYCLIGHLFYSALILIGLGIVGIWTESIGKAASIMAVRLWVLIGVQTVRTAAFLMPPKFIDMREWGSLDNKKMTILQRFLFWCVLYVFGDAFLCRVDMEGIFIPILMVSGNLLLLVLNFIFLRHNYLLAKNQYVEEEHERIEAERARELYRANHLRQLSNRDMLTGAYSRRRALEQLQAWKREGKLFSLAYIDLDGLKKANDSGGHDAGDLYLKRFAAGMMERLGNAGILARVGGDEFLVIFWGMDSERAEKWMNSARGVMELGQEPEKAVAFSFGIASGDGEIEALIQEADRRMYLDKRYRKDKDGSFL